MADISKKKPNTKARSQTTRSSKQQGVSSLSEQKKVTATTSTDDKNKAVNAIETSQNKNSIHGSKVEPLNKRFNQPIQTGTGSTTSQSNRNPNALLIVFTSLLLLATGLYFGVSIISKLDDINERLTEVEQTSSKIDTVPKRTQNLLIYGDENTAGDVPKTTNIENEAIMGERNEAKVAVVSYTDLNCPFCKKFASETLPLLEENYIKSNQIVFVHKDFPSVGGADSEDASAVALCVRKEKGDEKYFSFINDVYGFSETANLQNTSTLAVNNYGLEENQLKTCTTDQEIRNSIQSDLQEASTLGFKGTPSFIVGKIVDGKLVEGEEIVGAQPYTVFQQTIEKYTT